MTLTEFLLTRIADDEERAQFVKMQQEGNAWTPLEPWALSWHDEYDLLYVNPDRILAECEAKRRIVRALAAREAPDFESDDPRDVGATFAFRESCLALAAPYDDHPDYDRAWRS